MPQRLPPLNALRAFAAAGRLLSFRKAADELAVTPTAISHQIRNLEADLGARLFRRMTRRLQLTEAGQRLLPELAGAFDRIASAVERLRQGEAGGSLTISSLSTFSYRWLAPRLQRFQAKHPQYEIKVGVSQRFVDFARDEVDVGIRVGYGPWPGVEAIPLFEDRFTPLIARRMLEAGPKLRRPEDLLHYSLLREIGTEYGDWEVWFRAAGGIARRKAGSAVFDSSQLAVQAALNGLGVALVNPIFFEHEIKSGELVQPFPLFATIGKSYFLAYAEERADHPKIVAFRDWILAEIEAFKATPPEAQAARRRKASR
jgi:DNA-binding transcriptional LysR family regulator